MRKSRLGLAMVGALATPLQDGRRMTAAPSTPGTRERVSPPRPRRPPSARPALSESAESWYFIFWLLAVLSAIGVWIALGMTTAGAVGFGAALATVIAWLPVIAFCNIIRKEL